jgi:hypothetical protein
MVAAVHDVADLHKLRPPACPTAVAIDESRNAKDFEIPVVGAVHVANRHDALDPVELARARCARAVRGDRREGGRNEDRSSKAAREWSGHAPHFIRTGSLGKRRVTRQRHGTMPRSSFCPK